MKLIQRLIYVILLFSCAAAFADLRLDRNASPIKFEDDAAMRRFDLYLQPYVENKTYAFDMNVGGPYRPAPAIRGINSSFNWLLNGTRYSTAIVSFVTDNEMVDECVGYPGNEQDDSWKWSNCESNNAAHLICHLFMLNDSGKISGIGRIDIARDKRLIEGKPFCFEVKAMSAPPEVPDAFLITLGYIDSNWFPDPRNDPEQFLTTVLLRLKQEEDGKLSITQDSSCLGNPNRIPNLGTARKQLRECAARK